MNRILLVTATSVALILPAAAAFAQQQTQPETRPADSQVKELASLVNIIENTTDAGKATKAYARGAAIDRTSIPLHEAQMKKMLTLGQPMLAAYPAKSLNTLAPKNAIAWGVVGYYESRKKNYDEALRASLMSLELDMTNTSILYNGGELVAWYEFQIKPPTLTNRQKRTMDQLKENAEELENFSKGYNKVREAFEEQARLNAEFARLIEDAESEVDKNREDLRALGASAGHLDDEIDYNQEQIRFLRREYLFLYAWPRLRVIKDGEIQYFSSNFSPYSWIMHQQIRNEIDSAERAINRLRRQRNDIIRDAVSVKKDLRESKEKADEIRRKSLAAAKRYITRFRWDPPTVNGVLTPEQENLPRSTAKLPPRSKDPEGEADNKLQLAIAYIQNDMPEKAAEILQEILTDYKDTKVAKEARKLLDGIPKDKREKKNDS